MKNFFAGQFGRVWRVITTCLLCALAPLGAAAGTVTFTTNTLIDTTNLTYEGQDLVVQGCTVTVNGPHTFNSLSLQNAGVLTQSPTTTSQGYSLQVTVTGKLTVDATSRIDVSGTGYPANYTLGNTTVNASSGFSGGSYGGFGPSRNGTANSVYGDYRNPNELGSGGSNGGYGGGGAGGGLVRITAGSAQIDGQVLANGQMPGQCGSGSGGGIYLKVGTFSGGGLIAANGGDGNGWYGTPGGAGRVAIFYDTLSGFNLLTNVTAHGGASHDGFSAGVGTVYWQQTGQPGQLLIASHGTQVAGWTPLGQATDPALAVGTLIVSGTNVEAAPQHQMPIQAGYVSVLNGANLTQQPTTPTETYSLLLTVTNNLVVDTNSTIDVSGTGYPPNYTLGDTITNASSGFSGGSYGGLGPSRYGGSANAVYGDYHNPNELGSGGANDGYGGGGAGGGLLRITAGTAQIDGAILANGQVPAKCASGSGGGIYFKVGTLSGVGQIAVDGGDGNGWYGTPGGGGRVAIFYDVASGFDLVNKVTALGGAPYDGFYAAVGTVYLQQTGQPGQLLITTHGQPTGQWTPLGSTNDTVFAVDSLVLSGSDMVAATASGAPIQTTNLSLLNGATLTHLPTTPRQAYSLQLNVVSNLVVDVASAIDVSGLGYPANYTLGDTTTNASSGFSAGSYGGLGPSRYGGSANPVYGDFRNPNELGSGGANDGYTGGGAGGGLVRITAGSAKIDGEILANGQMPGQCASGSGGGVYLKVGTLSGAGQMAVNGGDGNGWYGTPGGGGRVAIYYDTLNGFNLLTNVTAHGGAPQGGFSAAVGTVYLKQTGQPEQLWITSHGTSAGQWTPLGQATNTVVTLDNLVVSGTNVVVAPQHQMFIQAGNLSVVSGANLTHQPTTTAQAYSLLLTVTNTFIVDTNSTIDVSGLGYPANYTLGDTTTNASSGFSGGSYGGLGGMRSAANPVYGDFRNPNELGSGGANSSYGGGGAGGGLVRITAGSAQIGGKILANGQTPYQCGAGSGGGIYLNVGTLSGGGLVTANGGNGNGWLGTPGSGGRIAIFYTAANGFDFADNVTTHGGAPSDISAAVGTVYLKQTGQPEQLWITSHGTPAGQWTPLGLDTNTAFAVANLVVSGTNVVVAPQHQMPVQAGNLSVVSGANFTHQPTTPTVAYWLQLVVTNNLVLDTNSTMDVSGLGYPANYTFGDTTVNASSGFSGGSYGGLGGMRSAANAVYGDYFYPNALGSGGANSGYGGGGAGGGLISIIAGTAQIGGKILANGQTPSACGAGSGGGIYLNVGTLSGSGLITANGGNGNGWEGTPGGGGRIAIFYTVVSGFDLADNVTTHGGAPSDISAAVGTVYLKQAGQPGQLWITSHGTGTGTWTPLGKPGDTLFAADALVVSGNGTVVATVAGGPIQVNNLSLLNGAVLTHLPPTATQTYSVQLNVANKLVVDASSRIDASNLGYPANFTLGYTTTGASSGFSGGSYGGLGGLRSAANPTYGDYRNPNEPGSGGANSSYQGGGAGGGLVRITAAIAQIDGEILANGQTPSQCGSGSGGGIYLKAGTLGGSGQVAANGGNGNGWYGTPGGGGRVAIYYDALAGFNLQTNVTAHGGAPIDIFAAVGTIYLQQTAQPGQLLITSHGTPAGQWTPLGLMTNTAFVADNLVISGTNVVVAAQYQMPIQAGSVSVINGANLTHQPTTLTQTYSLELKVTNNLVVDTNSTINVSFLGYPADYTLGDTRANASSGFSGGSYGGLGGANNGAPNAVYGDYHNPDEQGSGGANSGYTGGGTGGGLVRITAGSAEIDGAILANGQTPSQCGAGSGGGILLNVGTLEGIGQITANGGNANGWNGTSGGGGRVAIYTWNNFTLPASNIVALAGSGGNASTGSVYLASSPWLGFVNQTALWHGVQPISWDVVGLSPGQATAEVTVSLNGVTYFDQAISAVSSSLDWNTASVPDGFYTVGVNAKNASGQIVGQIAESVVVNNSAVWHEGVLTTNETWAAGTVHIVDQNVIVPNGVTLTLAPGAIVKFAKNTGITVQAGGILNALGASSASIILTSLADDSAGGDSNLDGTRSQPQAGDWASVAVQGGQFNANSFTDIRYSQTTLGGTIATSQSWLGNTVYLINGPVVIPTGVTLTINPGAVIKFAPGTGLTVQSGGTLNALGTVTEPITLTSLKDDSVGGDSNGDGNATTPAPGDWVGINNSGTVSLNHCTISYGGNTGGGAAASGVLISSGAGSSLAVSNSIVENTLWDGISVGYPSGGGTATVVNCVLRDLDRAIWAWGGGSVHLINCTFDQNLVSLVNHGGGTITAENCIIANSIQASQTEGATTVRYCDIWSSYPNSVNPIPVGQNGNISADPKFVNAPQGDYRLNYGSPGIDAADGTVAPATDDMGAPRYSDPRTAAKAGLPTALGVYADMGAFEFVETAASAVDLIAAAVSGPTEVAAGDTVTVQWMDVNLGSGPVVGPWHDTISLVSMADTNQVLWVGVSLAGQGVVLGPGQSCTNVANWRVPGGVECNYLWQVQVNSQGEVFEGANWANNTTLADTPTGLTDPALVLGASALSGQFTTAGQTAVFKLTPPAGQNLLLTLQGSPAGCALKLFVGQGYVPDPTHFDFESSQFNSPTAALNIPNPGGGVYYVVAYAQSLAVPTVSYTLAASALTTFALGAVTPGTIAGNGPVTLQITGSLLAPNDTYQLVGPGGTFVAASVSVPDSTTAYATFNLNGAAAGVYDLKVLAPGGPTVTLAKAVAVTAVASAAQLSTQLQLPSVYRVGRPFNGTIVYANVGNADMPAPILILKAGGVAGLRPFPTNSFSTGNLLLIGASLQGPAGVLRPGQTWSIPFSAQATTSVTIPFELDYETAGATDAVDYTALGKTVRPAGYSDADWNTLWSALQIKAGPTWGGLVAFLSQYATIMAQEEAAGQWEGTFYLVQDVLAYALADTLAQTQARVAGTLYLGDTNHPLANTLVFLASPDTNVVGTGGETRADGSFRILNPTAGAYSVNVPGYWLPAPVSVTVPPTGALTGLAWVVHQGGVVRGTLLNDSGTIFLTNVPVSAVGTGGGGFYTTRSGPDGSYLLGGLPPGSYDLSFGGAPYLPQSLPGVMLNDGQTLTTNLALALGAGVQGIVTGGGLPVAGAVVFATDPAGNQHTAVTDTNGTFALGGLPAGAYGVTIEAVGHAPRAATTTLAAGTTVDLGVVALDPGATIAVSLKDTASQAVANGLVTVTQNGQVVDLGYAVNGSIEFPDLAAGDYTLTVVAYGFQDATNTVTVAMGATVNRTVALTRLGSVAGQVTDGAGHPIAGLSVNLYGAGAANGDISLTVLTDAAGNYELDGLPAGPYLLRLGNNGGTDGRVVTIAANLASQQANFALTAAVIRGHVVAGDGSTIVKGATVNLARGGQLVASALTDTNGLYQFRALLTGDYSLAAGLTGTGISSNVTVNIKTTADLVQTNLALGGLQFGGSVTGAGSTPLANATFLLFRAGNPPAPVSFAASTGTDGTFTLHGLAAGSYVLQVRKSGYGTLVAPVNVEGTGNLPFALAAAASVTGTVTDSIRGLGVGGALVRFYDPGTHFLVAAVLTDASGHYTLTDLAVASYDMVVSQAQYQFAQLANVAVPAGVSTLNAVLAAPNTLLQGTVTDTASTPVAGARVSVVDNGTGETLVSLATADDGTWSTAQLPPGGYVVSFAALGYQAPAATAVTLAAGGAQTVAGVATPAATDDSDQGFFYGVSQQIGTIIFNLTGVTQPVRSPYYPMPPLNCDCAFSAFMNAFKAGDRAEQAFQYWQEQYDANAAITGASAGVAGADSLRLLADALATFTPGGKAAQAVTAFNGMSETEKATVYAIQGVTTGADQTKAVLNLLMANLPSMTSINPADPASVQQALTAMGATINDAAGVAGGIDGLRQILKGLNNEASEFTATSPLAVASDLISVFLDAWQTYNDYKGSLDVIQQAQLDYNTAYQSYLNARRAYGQANSNCNNCPPPPPPNPPIPPNPTPTPPHPVYPGQSFDPNDKLTVGAGTSAYVRPGDLITYTILFENQASASLPAQMVTVTDSLDANLDWSTVQLGTMGFNHTTISVPAGVQTFATQASVATDPNPVQVNATLNPGTGVITWLLQSVDPVTGQLVTDPLAGFLPPDNAQQAGEGYVTYTVRSRGGLGTGTRILNQANIVFDVNAPILTPTVTNTIDATPPVSAMAVLPATTPLTNLVVSWSGTDAGSGIASYEIFVSVNGGSWTPWQAGTTNTSAVFPAAYGNTYAFYSVAVDATGNVEAAPVVPGTTTAVLQTGQPVITSVTQSAGNLSFTWSTVVGKTYQVQYTTNLTQVVWHNLGSTVTANSVTLTASDSLVANPQRFYRIVMP